MIPVGADVGLRAVGAAIACVSIAFAGYMLAYGDGKVRVLGMAHLAIFAQARGPTVVTPPHVAVATVDMEATGSVSETVTKPRPTPRPEIVAARSDRAWLRVDGRIIAVAPGDDVFGLGRLGAIVRHGDGWAILDDKGATLLTLSGSTNGAALFSRRLIFE